MYIKKIIICVFVLFLLFIMSSFYFNNNSYAQSNTYGVTHDGGAPNAAGKAIEVLAREGSQAEAAAAAQAYLATPQAGGFGSEIIYNDDGSITVKCDNQHWVRIPAPPPQTPVISQPPPPLSCNNGDCTEPGAQCEGDMVCDITSRTCRNKACQQESSCECPPTPEALQQPPVNSPIVPPVNTPPPTKSPEKPPIGQPGQPANPPVAPPENPPGVPPVNPPVQPEQPPVNPPVPPPGQQPVVATPRPTNAPRPTPVPTPAFNPAMCKCDGIETTGIFAGQQVSVTAFGKVEGGDTSKASIRDITFRLTRDNTVLAKSNPIPAQVVSKSNTLVRSKATWNVNIPANVDSKSLYRIFADITCNKNLTRLQLPDDNSPYAQGVDNQPSFFQKIITFFRNIFSKKEAARTEVQGAHTEEQKSIQLKSLSPAQEVQKTCKFIYFKFPQGS